MKCGGFFLSLPNKSDKEYGTIDILPPLQKTEENGWEIENMEVMPDYVHIFVKTTPSDSPAFVAAQLKGFTSHQLREEFPHLRSRLPTLWTRSYYTESVGHISEETIKKYIDEQKLK